MIIDIINNQLCFGKLSFGKISYGKNKKLSLWKQEDKQVSNELNTPSLMTIEL